MKILKFPLGQLQANCYFIIQDKRCLVIDPADEADFILEQIQRRGLKVEGLLATHGHFDHIMAAGEIQASLPRVEFYLSAKDEFLVKRLISTARHFLGYEPAILLPKKITSLNIGRQKIGSFEFEVITTPGHTPGSVCYHLPAEKALLTGDTLFAGAVGRTDLSYSSKTDLTKSLQKIFRLPENTAVFAGHGGKTWLSNERGVIS